MTIELKVNGETKTWEAAPDEFLSETLRRHGFVSVKTGCGVGSCGLCTVWIDGSPRLSCSTLSVRAAGTEVTTLEGVRGEAAEFARFLVGEGADQCGFCSPGLVMLVLAAARDLGRDPEEEELRRYLDGNLCRCTGYFGRIRAVRAYLKARPS